jgi:MerR family copper efflux transcriptional regulator
MNIGRAAKASGISAKMIRYYESRRLIDTPSRTAAGYRTYSEADVDTLRFIRRARDLGFTVDAIARLLELWRSQTRSSADVKKVAVGHIAELRQRIAEMQAMVRTLERLADQCHANDRPDCPILDGLAEKTIAAPDWRAAMGNGSERPRTPRLGAHAPTPSSARSSASENRRRDSAFQKRSS